MREYNQRKRYEEGDVMKQKLTKIIAVLLAVILCVQNVPETTKNVKAATVYNPSKAVAYARKYALNYNSAFHNYNPDGGDCANFVSQCLVEGGLQPNNSWGIYEQGGEIRGNAAWVGATSLLNYFKNSDEFKNLVVANPSYSDMKAGNPMWLTMGHVVICTADGGTWCAHNVDYIDHAPMTMLYTVRLDKLANQNRDPVGFFDLASSTKTQKIRVAGWAYDPDNPSASIDVHVYVGGEAGQAGTEAYVIKANAYREDVNKAQGISGNHGFDKEITVKKSGSQKIAIYAINSPSGNNPRIGDVKTVNIAKDTEKPKVSNVKIYNVTKDGYDVSFEVSDNVGVVKAECPTWSDKNGQDDLIWHKATIKNGVATCHIKRSDHNNEFGKYITHCYAWDNQNNNTFVATSTMLEEHEWDSFYTIDKQPTCTENGSKSIHCKTCSATKDTQVIYATGHSYSTKITPATATQDGSIVESCSMCGDIKSSQIIPLMKEVIISSDTYEYTGNAIIPSVTAKDRNGNIISSEYYEVSYKNNINVGTASVNIKGKNLYSCSFTVTFSITAKQTSAPTVTPKPTPVTSPTTKPSEAPSGSKVKNYNLKKTKIHYVQKKKKGFNVGWEYVKNNSDVGEIDGWQIQVSTNKKFKKGVKTYTIKNPYRTYKKIRKLKSKKKYYIRVRSYKLVSNKNYYSKWSTPKKAKTK